MYLSSKLEEESSLNMLLLYVFHFHLSKDLYRYDSGIRRLYSYVLW